MSFTLHESVGVLSDQATITSGRIIDGASSVWITYKEANLLGDELVAHGASVTGLGSVGTFSLPQIIPNSKLFWWNDIAIGYDNQVAVVAQEEFEAASQHSDSKMYFNLDGDGLGSGGFSWPALVAITDVGTWDVIDPQPDRAVDAEVGLAYDRFGDSNNLGRLYLVYTDEFPDETDDCDIFVRFSDDDGTNWSTGVRVNDDATANSQFMPRIALDQTSGFVAVSWHDSRNDDGLGGDGDTDGYSNNEAQLFAAVSVDGGLTFSPNIQVSDGTSDEERSDPPENGRSDLDYGDYAGLAFEDGNFYPAWADNSNSTADNPNGNTRMEVYTAKVPEPGQLMLLGTGILGLFGLSSRRKQSD